MANNTDAAMPCCPQLLEDDHCDIINFSRVLSYPTTQAGNSRRRITVEVILHFKFSRCTLGLTLGDPAYSITLLPGEKVRLSTTDRRSRFTYDSESKLSYRSEQISEEQYFMTATQKYMADASSAQSGHAENSSEGQWDFHGDAEGSIGIFSLSASASTSAGGSHNNHSVSDYLNQQKTHMQSSASQAVSATRKAHAVSIGEVSSRTHIQGESEDHFEASSREFSNYNKCHAVTYMFYRLNKKQKVKFELVSIERRVLDDNAPVGGVLQPGKRKVPIALVPQDLPATATLKRSTVLATAAAGSGAAGATPFSFDASSLAFATAPVLNRVFLNTDANQGTAIDGETRQKALREVDEQLMARNLIDKAGNVATETKQKIDFEMQFSLPTPGIIVKGCLDDCDVCEPLLKERMQLENDLLRRQIELLEKSQDYRCCPAASLVNED